MKKNILYVSLILVLMLTLATSSVFAETITLRFGWWGSQLRHNRTIEVIELYEELNPNVNIEPEFSGWDGYWEKMAAQAAGKNLPDIFQHSYAYLIQYVNNDLVLNLNPYLEEGVFDTSDISNEELAGGMLNDKLYAINLGSNSYSIVYNPELFEKANVKKPHPDWTWDEFENMARKINEELGIYGASMATFSGEFYGMLNYTRQYNQHLYSEDKNSLGYEDDKLYSDFYNIFIPLVEEEVLAPLQHTAEETIEDNLLTNGESAMMSINSNQTIALASAAPDKEFKMMVVPHSPDRSQSGSLIVPSQLIAVAKNSEHPKEAVKFINFFINNSEANKILKAERGVPINSKIRKILEPIVNDATVKTFDFIELATKHSSPGNVLLPEEHGEINQLIMTLYEKMAYGMITPEEAASTFRKESNNIFD